MTEPIDDSQRPLRLFSPLMGTLAVSRFNGTESLGRLFEFHLELISNDQELAFKKIVGQSVTLHMEIAGGAKRYFNGYVTEFRFIGGNIRFSRYQAVVRPWLWFLTRTSDCRIFQEQTVPDIIKAVFADNGMSEYEDRLTGTYREWNYCVQYRETDFNFISRLMEQEGIYYYFLHEDGKHTLVLADDLSCHSPQFGFPTCSYFPPTGEMTPHEEDHLQYWNVRQSMQPESFAIEDFDFEKPKVRLASRVEKVREFANPLPDAEFFDYPGEFSQQGEGDTSVEHRMQEMQSQHERVQASGPCRMLASGALVTLEDHPRADQNKEYLIVSVTHTATAGAFFSDSHSSERLYDCQVELLDKAEPFRSARVSPKPVVHGCQTAMVVGPEGEEIHCDSYGRVKVQFHWDRYGSRDENSSCWIRVSQIWAGANWGSQHIPRIGQEVIVSFLEGDPDRPIVTGRVYNAESMPVYTLPANKTQSGIKSRSTPEGGASDFNEIRFEDKKGEDEVYVHAEKNMKQIVENDLSTTVYNSEDRTVKDTRQTYIGDNDNKRPEETIESLVVQGQRLQTIYGNDGLTVLEGSKGRMVHIQDGNYELLIDKGDYKLEVTMGNKSTNVVAGSSTEEAMQSIEFKVGSNSIKIDQTGVTIKGLMVKIKADAILEASGSMSTVKGSATLKLEGGGLAELKGGVVMIN